MPNEIWVFAEQQEGKVRKVTFELLSAGAEFSKKTGSAGWQRFYWEAVFKKP